MSQWLITNKNIEPGKRSGLSAIVSSEQFKLLSDFSRSRQGEPVIHIDGYILPRARYFDTYKNYDQISLIRHLYKEFQSDCIQYIKGFFNLIIIDNDKFFISNDRSGLYKFFYYISGNDFIISNNLKLLCNSVTSKFNHNQIAIFSLMEHFVDGDTLFDNIKYSTPASQITYENNIRYQHYWNSEELLHGQTQDIRIEEIALRIKSLINQYIEYLNLKNISLTLTGGHDSRIILAALLNLNLKPSTFSFGDPESYDALVARKLSERANIGYSCYFNEKPDSKWFSDEANQIITFGNSLINIHRAHRLDSIKKEHAKLNTIDSIFAGFMGGDYIRGINLDDYITPKLVRLWWNSNYKKTTIIQLLLKEKFLDEDKFDFDFLYDKLGKLRFLKTSDKRTREFFLNTDLIASMHDSQDTLVFAEYANYPVNIYMDDDFLETLFSSSYSMIFKDHSTSNYFKRINDPYFACNILEVLLPQFNDIEFSKNYSPKEFLSNKFIYVVKRILRQRSKKQYPANFPLNKWMFDYVKNEIVENKEYLSDYYDLKAMNSKLRDPEFVPIEKYWHQFTNYINIIKNIKYFES